MVHPAQKTIDLFGVRVHNLKGIDLRLPLHQFVVITGVSGSGKSSLAFDTLYAEGQRRYIESFSAYARQFLDPLEKPDADRIEHIPPAIAIRQSSVNLSSKSTVATATELHDYLRLLFAKIGRIICPGCKSEIRNETPATALETIHRFAEGTRFQICFPLDRASEGGGDELAQLQTEGFTRLIAAGRTLDVRDFDKPAADADADVWAVVDRLAAGKATDSRILDSLELAFREGDERCILLEEYRDKSAAGDAEAATIDGNRWLVHRHSGHLVCEPCGREFVRPEPRLFSFNAPLGACPECQGFGAVPAISLERLVPDSSKTLREGAIAAWTTPAYRHELDELLELAGDYDIPVDVPFHQLEPRHLDLITDGVAERQFGGLKGFFRWLERHKYKLSARVFLNRWRTYETCPACRGDRLQSPALAVRIEGRNIADVCRRSIREINDFFAGLEKRFSDVEQQVTRTILTEIASRLEYLSEVGLDYLTLDRTVRTLSGGEAQRIALTAALGSSLVNTLYVLDEPSAGLHPRDSRRVIDAIRRLRDAGNTVVVVEHEDAFVLAADEVVDIGPGAGHEGGRLVFQGTPDELEKCEESITGAYLSGRRSIEASLPATRRRPDQGWLRLQGAREHNLKNLTVEFPLGVLCVVTGVSGSGKSTLIAETLYPALCRALKQAGPLPQCGQFDQLSGAEEIDEVLLVDHQPVGRTPRSNPVTYLKAFDEIRKVFAQTAEAKLRNYTATHFSFNAATGGRCPKCTGNGSIRIDMQFLADVSMICPECHGTRYQREILEVKYRGLTIAEVLGMTVREAFTFFRSQPRLQKRLQLLKDVGLAYLPLGQPATTLSGGESQRLKLAARLASGSRRRGLFLLDEPTTGLHAADVVKLLACFSTLLSVGHSLIVIEHNLDVIKAADHLIDLGPEAGDAGGEIVACGTPENVCAVRESITGRFLRAKGVK